MKLPDDSFAAKAISYFLNLNKPSTLPSPVSAINPYTAPVVQGIVREFYSRFFNDAEKRVFIFGINPGRFGGGITGIPFTDPAALQDYCNIDNDFTRKRELSSIFIYELINLLGGASYFYSKFYLTALYPFALIKGIKNFNYYDDKTVFKLLEGEIERSFRDQTAFGADNSAAVSLGKKNAVYLNSLNEKYRYFNNIIVLEHPRYIMQYKRKQLHLYLSDYSSKLKKLV